MESLLSEIDHCCAVSTPERVSRIVHLLLDQYVAQAPSCTTEQLDLYDQALLVLVKRLSVVALADISRHITSSGAAPAATLLFLAENPDYDVAGPVLLHAPLPDEFLARVVKGKRGPQLMAVAARASLSSELGLALIDSGIPAVVGQTVKNHNVELSEIAFSQLIGMAAKDRELARLIALRTDVPDELRSFVDMILQ